MSNLEQKLQFTNANFININDDRKEYTNHYNTLRDTLYKKLKEENPVGIWLRGHKLGGSYADNLKITKPNEFDLVVYLTFPENDKIIVKKDPKLPGNVTLDMTEVLKVLVTQKNHDVSFTNLKKIVSDKNLLLENKLQNMIKSAMTRALTKMNYQIEVDGKVTKLVYKICGPAHTICIKEDDFEYSVDFVPAIRLNAKQNILGQEELKYFKNITYWDAIPKPLKPPVPSNVSFRASYYEAENKMLRQKAKLKDAIRFMKKFRDSKQNMNNLKSYYIKTVLLWQLKIKNHSYWEEKQLKEILIDMFGELAKCLETGKKNGKLLFFWDPNLDMFASLTLNQRADMFNCVTGQVYLLNRSNGNLTEDIANNLTCSFSVQQERQLANGMNNLQLGKPNPKPEVKQQPQKKPQQPQKQPQQQPQKQPQQQKQLQQQPQKQPQPQQKKQPQPQQQPQKQPQQQPQKQLQQQQQPQKQPQQQEACSSCEIA